MLRRTNVAWIIVVLAVLVATPRCMRNSLEAGTRTSFARPLAE
jgi:hypothetical protein